MRNRLLTLLMIALMSFGAVACDDTEAGVEEDAQDVEEAVDDADADVDVDVEATE